MGTRRTLKLSNRGEVDFFEDSANGTSKVVLKAPAALAADRTFVLPDADGSAGQVLKTDGAGNLAFAPASATPAAHATSHQDGGSDEIATDTPAADAIPKAAGTGRLDTGWLGSGVASADDYLRGDQAWAPISDLVGRPVEYFRQVGTATLEAWYAVGPVGDYRLGGTPFQTEDLIVAWPLATNRGGTIDRIRIYVDTAGGALSTVRFGIYNSTSETNLYPGGLAVDLGEVATNGTGWKQVTLAQGLVANTLYWIAMNSTGGGGTVPKFTAYASGSQFSQILGFPAAGAATDPSRHFFTVAQAYGAMPDPFPAAATAESASTTHPALQIRYFA